MSDWLEKPNAAMDAVLEFFRRRADLGSKSRIWQTIKMPMSKPGFRGLDLIECPVEIDHTEFDGRKWLPIEPGWDRDSMAEDDLMEFLAGHPPESRIALLATAAGQKPGTQENIMRYTTLASIMGQTYVATAAAMEDQRALWEDRKYRP